jgi:hypothetical protein
LRRAQAVESADAPAGTLPTRRAGLIAIEDLGLQNRLIAAPDLWREIFDQQDNLGIDDLAHR